MSKYSFKVERWVCNKCHTQHHSQQQADKCCRDHVIRYCPRCGRRIEDTYFEWNTLCNHCKEFKRVERAERVENLSPDAYVIIPETDIFCQLDSLEEELGWRRTERFLEFNGYVYLTTFMPLEINNYEDMLYEEHHEDIQGKGVEELEAAISKFNKLNADNGTYYENSKRIHIYDQKLFEEYVRENSKFQSPLDRALGIRRT